METKLQHAARELIEALHNVPLDIHGTTALFRLRQALAPTGAAKDAIRDARTGVPHEVSAVWLHRPITAQIAARIAEVEKAHAERRARAEQPKSQPFFRLPTVNGLPSDCISNHDPKTGSFTYTAPQPLTGFEYPATQHRIDMDNLQHQLDTEAALREEFFILARERDHDCD